jgi:anti-sigma factor RsiW
VATEGAPLPRSRPARRYLAPIASALAAAALVLVMVRITQPSFLYPSLASADLVAEGVNDHLRVIASSHPVEIESGGIHQVKPWFTGRLDFAPRVGFSGDDQYQLAGGSVGYFRDRKAAVFVFKLRLHTISLFVFPAAGLPWRTHGLERVGPLAVDARVSRGFNVLLWRDGELGYCLVSDVNRADLDALAVRIAATEPSP